MPKYMVVVESEEMVTYRRTYVIEAESPEEAEEIATADEVDGPAWVAHGLTEELFGETSDRFIVSVKEVV